MRPTIIRSNAVDLILPKNRIRNEFEVLRHNNKDHNTPVAHVSKEITYNYKVKNEIYIINKATKSITLTLPTETAVGRNLYIINLSDFQVTIDGNANVVSLTGNNISKVNAKCFLQLLHTADGSWLLLSHS